MFVAAATNPSTSVLIYETLTSGSERGPMDRAHFDHEIVQCGEPLFVLMSALMSAFDGVNDAAFSGFRK